MKIGLQTWGTDGDFFPFLALANGLKNAGNEVTLAYTSIDGKDYSNHPNAARIKLIRANGNASVEKAANPYALSTKPGSFQEYTKLLETYFDPFTESMYEASKELCKKNDLVIGHTVCHTLLTAGQKYNTPRVSLVLTPIVVRSKYTSPIGVNLGSTLHSLLWNIGGKFSTKTWFKRAKAIRKQEGLPPIQSLQKELFTSDFLTLVASSPEISRPQSDWTETTKMCGFLNLESNSKTESISEELKLFIDSGEPPVYMTFGSCMQYDEHASTSLLFEAAQKLNRRVIIQSNYPIPEIESHSTIFQVSRTPHLLVFPKCAAIVHHGGAGTTQAALLAGKPSVVVPHGFDQLYWAKQLESIGAAGKPILRQKLSSDKLVNELVKLLSNTFAAENASRIGKKMQKENGVAKAVEIISKLKLK